VCPEKNFSTILTLPLDFVSKAKCVDWLRQGSWLKTFALLSAVMEALACSRNRLLTQRRSATADKFAASY
jgi:hypothetical protein